jgi:hypothetical protein
LGETHQAGKRYEHQRFMAGTSQRQKGRIELHLVDSNTINKVCEGARLNGNKKVLRNRKLAFTIGRAPDSEKISTDLIVE